MRCFMYYFCSIFILFIYVLFLFYYFYLSRIKKLRPTLGKKKIYKNKMYQFCSILFILYRIKNFLMRDLTHADVYLKIHLGASDFCRVKSRIRFFIYFFSFLYFLSGCNVMTRPYEIRIFLFAPS